MIINVPDVDPLVHARNAASLTKSEFILACVGAGILADAEALAVGRGGWPSSMESFLSFLDAEQAIAVQIDWASRGDINRMNVFVLSLGSWLGMTNAQLDDLFGIGGA